MSTVAFDFDGVIHAYSRGWDDGTIYDEPIEGAFEMIKQVQREHAVFIHTTRDTRDVAHWMIRHDNTLCCVTEVVLLSGWTTTWRCDDGVSTDDPMIHGIESFTGTIKFWDDQTKIFVTSRKLPALAYVDDRAIRFFNPRQTLIELMDRGILPYPPAGDDQR